MFVSQNSPLQMIAMHARTSLCTLVSQRHPEDVYLRLLFRVDPLLSASLVYPLSFYLISSPPRNRTG
ncbi:Hypothetical protein NTJ_04952 [Nesidiocoris tenuis]|uniref:Uncharacterized protein n=1 Tax=Nesidiocoris tenuis TaxID=355587 RepID=A0ABN7ALN9_9HEMI|nr:Hypothetical protein NTJ_04952 [Nesidiocoris tenuis]